MLKFNIDRRQFGVLPKLKTRAQQAHKAEMLLLDDIAQDVSRITGIPWAWERVETKAPKRPCINLFNLDPIDRLRVSLALVGGHYYCDLTAATAANPNQEK